MAKKRIVCFGDSNTWGCRPDNNLRFKEDERWPKVLQSLLGDRYEIIEEGHCGRTTVWTDPVEGIMSGADYLVPCLQTHNPFDLLLIMLGTNDCKDRYNMHAKTIAYCLERLVLLTRQVLSGEDTPQILLVSPILIGEQYKKHYQMHAMFGENAVERSEGLAAALEPIAEKNGCAFLDAAAVAEPSPIDGIHMELEDGKKLAQALCEKIRELLPAE